MKVNEFDPEIGTPSNNQDLTIDEITFTKPLNIENEPALRSNKRIIKDYLNLSVPAIIGFFLIQI